MVEMLHNPNFYQHENGCVLSRKKQQKRASPLQIICLWKSSRVIAKVQKTSTFNGGNADVTKKFTDIAHFYTLIY